MTDSAAVPNPYETKLLARFTETRVVQEVSSGNTETVVSEKACDYIYRAVDRQINKARGVLAYNGLLFASFSLAARSSTDKIILMLASVGAIVALSSCFPLLYLMIFNIGEVDQYATARSDFEGTFSAVWRRTRSVTASLWLSLLATLIAVLIPIILLSVLLC